MNKCIPDRARRSERAPLLYHRRWTSKLGAGGSCFKNNGLDATEAAERTFGGPVAREDK